MNTIPNQGKINLENLLENLRFLTKEMANKIILAKGFTTPAIETYGMNSFHMSAPEAFASP